jgi:hypothetical protein
LVGDRAILTVEPPLPDSRQLGASFVEGDPEIEKHLRRDAAFFSHETEKKVLRVHGTSTRHPGLGHRELEDGARSRCIGELLLDSSRAAAKHCLLEHLSQLLAIHSQQVEDDASRGGRAILVPVRVVKERQQKMFGTDVLVLETRGFFARLAQYSP